MTAASSFTLSAFRLLQAEGNRQGEASTHCFTTLLTRIPLRHRVHHAESLFVQIWVHTANHLCITYRTVTLNHETYSYTTLSTVLLSDGRILDILRQPLHQSSIAARECGRFLYDFEDFLLIYYVLFLFLNGNGWSVLNLNLLASFLRRKDGRLLNVRIIVHDGQSLSDRRSLWWRWSLHLFWLFRDRNLNFFLKYNFGNLA